MFPWKFENLLLGVGAVALGLVAERIVALTVPEQVAWVQTPVGLSVFLLSGHPLWRQMALRREVSRRRFLLFWALSTAAMFVIFYAKSRFGLW